jgi:hypothetical protein
MEAFPIGSHVVIELADERKIAGYLAGGSVEEGVLLQATHKDAELVRHVSAGLKASIADQLAAKNVWWLRAGMLTRGHFRGVVAGREQMEAQLQWDIEEDILKQADDGIQFRALSSPVTTYIHPGAILLMERSEDKNTEAEISLFDQTLDDALEKMLTEGDETKEDDGQTDGLPDGSEEGRAAGREEDS